MLFARNEPKELISDELRTFLERVTILEARVTSLELDASSFRDKVLRKIQNKAEPEQEKLKPTLGAKVRR